MLEVTFDTPVATLMSRTPVRCRLVTTLRGLAMLLTEQQVGAAVVVDGAELLGIVTERDLLAAIADGADPDHERVSTVMTDEVETVTGSTTLWVASTTMLRDEIRHLVVVEDAEVVGILSIRDALAALMEASERRTDVLPDVVRT
jgi:CBS domain-containing protein